MSSRSASAAAAAAKSSAKLLIAQCKSLSDVVRVESDATPNSLALTEKRNSGHVRYDGERRRSVNGALNISRCKADRNKIIAIRSCVILEVELCSLNHPNPIQT